ncbi:MAG: insulinase family protein [Bacteroidales bacterium]|jgi:predicted Zn-dependent peptidase|nr:insulinase family protein [Bacteroidales bacterium]
MIDRTIAPEIQKIDKIDYQTPEEFKLPNGIKIFCLKSDNSPVVKIDVVFKAGITFQTEKLQAIFANSLLKEAPEGKIPNEIAAFFDYYGSFIENYVGTETAGIKLYVPSYFVEEVLPVFADLFINPSMPEKEFGILKNKQEQLLLSNLEKTKYLAMRTLNNELFGNNNPAGQIINPEDISAVSLDSIRNFVSDYYRANNCYIILSGMITDDLLKLCDKYFGVHHVNSSWNNNSGIKKINYPINESSEKFRWIEVKNSVQSSLYLGKNLGTLSNEELIDVGILNTVFGGYFGSRLMKNIREDKGYTYGIGSFILEYPQTSTLKITSDVGTDVAKATIKEIFKEMEILRNELISELELELVKNYMLGEIISSFDGVINSSEIWEKLISNGKSNDYIDMQIDRIKNITSIELKDIANKYLIEEGFHTVVAGREY